MDESEKPALTQAEQQAELQAALLAEADRLGHELRTLIVKCKDLPKMDEAGPHQALRYTLSRAQESLQTGMLWLRKCITRDMRF